MKAALALVERDGAVCLRQWLSPDEAATLRRGIDHHLAQYCPLFALRAGEGA